MAKYLGFDGYRRGWVAAWISDDGDQGFDYSPSLNRLLSMPYRRAMIDIPIGLPDTGFRHCDLQARKILGPSVFAGARRGLWLNADYSAANKKYWATEGERMGISRQLWAIRDKIKGVDDLITRDLQGVLCETHPELVFWARNSKKALEPKKTSAGRRRRIDILKRLGFTSVERWLGLRFGTGIGRDDLIDACACAIAARDAKCVLDEVKRDVVGLKMEMHYCMFI